MYPTLLVMIGGAIGAAARFHLGGVAARAFGPAFPAGTLIANVSGGLAMGLLAATLARTGDGETWRLLLGVGVLGGFTTFSAFSLETVAMIERGEALLAFGYVAASVLGALGALGLGLAIGRAAA
jgi:fluoride exporter